MKTIEDIYLPQIEQRLVDMKELLSPEARTLSQSIISNLRCNDRDISLPTSKRVLGEVCRALRIESVKAKFDGQYFITLWNDSDMGIAVMVSTEMSVFETLGNALNPNN